MGRLAALTATSVAATVPLESSPPVPPTGTGRKALALAMAVGGLLLVPLPLASSAPPCRRTA